MRQLQVTTMKRAQSRSTADEALPACATRALRAHPRAFGRARLGDRPACARGDAAGAVREWRGRRSGDRRPALGSRPPCLVVVPAHCVHGFHYAIDRTARDHRRAAPARSMAGDCRARLGSQSAAGRAAGGSRGPAAQALVPLFDAIAREARTTAGQVAAGMSLLAALIVQVARISQSTQGRVGDPARARPCIERFRALLDPRFGGAGQWSAMRARSASRWAS